MKDEENKNKKIEEQTPIMDGDTRPDKQEEAVTMDRKNPPIPIPHKKGKKVTKEKKMTKERGADVDSLEDFKDAK